MLLIRNACPITSPINEYESPLMHWQPTPYVIPLLLAAALSVSLAVFVAHRRRAPGSVPFVWLMVGVSVWSLGYAVELASVDLQVQLLCTRIQYLGIVSVPVTWFLFAQRYAGRDQWMGRRNVALLAFVPSLTTLLVWTNQFHGLMYARVYSDTSGPFIMLQVTYGPWFVVHTIFSYSLLILGTVRLIQVVLPSPRPYRGQAAALLVAAFFPWLGNALHITRLGPFPGLDLTPFAFALTGLMAALALHRFRLLDIVPVARNAVIECMDDALIVLDEQSRVVDLNPAAVRVLGPAASSMIGQPVDRAFASWAHLVERYRGVTDAQDEIVLGEDGRHFDLRLSPVHDRNGRLTGKLVVLRDITDRIQSEAEVKRRLEEMTLLTEITTLISSGGTMTSALQTVCAKLAGFLQIPQAGFAMIDAQRDTAVVIADHHPPGASSAIGVEIPLSGNPSMEHILAHKTPLVVEDAQADPILAPIHDVMRQRKVRSILIVPIMVGGQVIGTLGFDSLEPRSFSQADIDLVQHAASQAGQLLMRARAEEELRESEEQYRTTLDLMADGIHVVDCDLRILLFNSSFRQWCLELGLETDVIGRRLPDVFPFLSETVFDEYRHVLASGETLITEEESIISGRRFVTETRKIPIWEGERIARVVTAVRDITERKHAEQELRESEERFRRLSDAAEEGILIHDAGLILEANEALARMFGYEVDELVGTLRTRLISEEYWPLVEEHITQEHDIPYEVVGVRKDGSTFDCEMVGKPYQYRGTTLRLAVLRDVTERKRAERLLQALNEAALALARALTPHEVLAAVGQELKKLGFSCVVFLLDEQGEALCPTHVTYPLHPMREAEKLAGVTLEQVNIPVSEAGPYGKVIQEGRARFIEDVYEATRHLLPPSARDYTEQIIEMLGIPKSIAAPLIVEDRIVGLLSVQSNALTEDDVAAITAFAHQLAAAWRKAQLYEQAQQEIVDRLRVEQALQQRNRELALLHDAGQALSSTIAVERVLDTTLEEVGRLLGVVGCSIWLVDSETDQLVCMQATGPKAASVRGWRMPRGEGIAGHVAHTGEVLIVADAREDRRYFRGVEDETGLSLRSILAIPLRVKGRVTGVLEITDVEPNRFHEPDLTLLESLSNSAAIAIENARLIEGLEEEVAARTAEIKAEQEKSEAILQNVGDAIAMFDPDLRIQYVNPAFTQRTGYQREEVLGREIFLLLGGVTAEQSRQSLLGPLNQGQPWQGEITVHRKDGRLYEALLTVAPIRDAVGRVTGFVSSHEDISRLKDLDRARSRFITTVSHQLRTPVTNMKLYAHLLRSGRRVEKTEQYLQVLDEQADRLSHLIQDILEMTNLDGQTIGLWSPVSLSTLIEHVMNRFRSLADQTGVLLEAEPIPPDLPLVNGDHIRLNHALAEVVENAVAFTPAGGSVSLAVAAVNCEGESWVTITVRDTGPGISADEQGRIFDRFYRGKVVESGQLPGTGLGLSMVQRIMEAHGGRVTVDSQLGQGSTFTLWLKTVD
jgi:PAS domain S-box-containing protein